MLADAPDSQLDAQGTKMCREFNPDTDDPVRFLRNLLDLSVRYAWASGFVIKAMELVLMDEPPETPEEAEARRAELLAKWEPGGEL